VRRRLAVELGIARIDFVRQILHQTTAPLQMSGQLFDEVLEARFALGAHRVLLRLGHGSVHRKLIPDEQAIVSIRTV